MDYRKVVLTLMAVLVLSPIALHPWSAQAGRSLSPSFQSSGNEAEIVSTLNPPTIDGAVDDVWATANRYTLSNQLLGNSPLAASNLSASFRSLYDATTLYFLIEVTDDVKINDSADNPNFYDTVEIYLDGNFSRGTEYDTLDDRVTLFRWNDSEPHASSLSLHF